MNPRTLTAVGLGVAITALTACSAANHSEDADELGDQLRDLPGVEEVRVDYVQPEMLDAADVNLEVVMADEADPGLVAAVFKTAYAGLTEAHADEEGNLKVRWNDDQLTLRTFESDADPIDVADAAEIGAQVAAVHANVFVNVMTQDVAKSPHVESLALVRLPSGSDAADRRRVHDEIAAAYRDRAVRVDVRIRRR